MGSAIHNDSRSLFQSTIIIPTQATKKKTSFHPFTVIIKESRRQEIHDKAFLKKNKNKIK